MKKTLLSVLAGVAVIGSANAGIKETCLEHPDKLVWVEKTQRCIPINPCKSDDADIKRAYCIEYTFYDFPITEGLARKVIEKYFEYDGSVTELKFFKSDASVGVTYDNGNYAEIKFLYFVPDLEPHNKELDFTGLACAAITKKQPFSDYDENYIFCPEAHNHETCREVYKFGKELGSGRTNAMAIWDDLDKRCKLKPFEF